jgi:iron(III) transport system permease protein
MTRWRIVIGLGLLVFAGLPLLAPLDELRRLPSGWQVWSEAERLLGLLRNSLLLTFGTLALVIPLGLAGAILFFRTDLPGRQCFQFLAILALFVPLPLVTTACQMGFGAILPPGPGSAWSIGIFPAILLHVMLGLPWCIVISGLGLTWVEPELEEDALTLMPPWQVLWRVTLPRALPMIILAALVVALQTWSEIAVTDFVQVRTFAEEVFYQVAGGSEAGWSSAVAVALPAVLVVLAITSFLIGYWRTRRPARAVLLQPPRVYELDRWRWPVLVLVILAALVLIGLPLFGLIEKAGLRYGTSTEPGPPTWDAWLLIERVLSQLDQQRWLLVKSGGIGLGAGLAAALLALVCAWLSRGSRWFEVLVWLLAAALWAMPGPILGIGWLDWIQLLMRLPGGDLIRLTCYERPSPLPNLWICTLRFFPIGLAILWPLVRLLPKELEEAAMLDGLGPWRRFFRVLLPALRGPLLWTVLVVGTLTLGEISATKITSTPNFTPLAHHVFQQMHARADTELAALALLMLSMVQIGGTASAVGAAWLRRSEVMAHQGNRHATRTVGSPIRCSESA